MRIALLLVCYWGNQMCKYTSYWTDIDGHRIDPDQHFDKSLR